MCSGWLVSGARMYTSGNKVFCVGCQFVHHLLTEHTNCSLTQTCQYKKGRTGKHGSVLTLTPACFNHDCTQLQFGMYFCLVKILPIVCHICSCDRLIIQTIHKLLFAFVAGTNSFNLTVSFLVFDQVFKKASFDKTPRQKGSCMLCKWIKESNHPYQLISVLDYNLCLSLYPAKWTLSRTCKSWGDKMFCSRIQDVGESQD